MNVENIIIGDTVEYRSGGGLYNKDLGRCLVPFIERAIIMGKVTAVYPNDKKIRVGDMNGRNARTVHHYQITSHTPIHGSKGGAQ